MKHLITAQSVDRDLAEASRRYDRAMLAGDLELADVYERSIDRLLDQRIELTATVDA